jgi:hypothetical protein
MEAILLLHVAATLFLCGLTWTIQTVHYPLFASVGRGSFASYELEHQSRVSRVVAPMMLLELVTGVVLLGGAGGEGSRIPFAVGFALIALIWVSTGLQAVPRHRELSLGFDAESHRGLLRANWNRTIAWSARAVLVLWILGTSGVGR